MRGLLASHLAWSVPAVLRSGTPYLIVDFFHGVVGHPPSLLYASPSPVILSSSQVRNSRPLLTPDPARLGSPGSGAAQSPTRCNSSMWHALGRAHRSCTARGPRTPRVAGGRRGGGVHAGAGPRCHVNQVSMPRLWILMVFFKRNVLSPTPEGQLSKVLISGDGIEGTPSLDLGPLAWTSPIVPDHFRIA